MLLTNTKLASLNRALILCNRCNIVTTATTTARNLHERERGRERERERERENTGCQMRKNRLKKQ